MDIYFILGVVIYLVQIFPALAWIFQVGTRDLFFLTFLLLFERETEHGAGGAEREGDTESKAGSRL